MPKKIRKKRNQRWKTVTCKQCKGKFLPTSPHDEYCSTRCRLPMVTKRSKSLAEAEKVHEK